VAQPVLISDTKPTKSKLTFKEKYEFEQLEKDMSKLEKEKYMLQEELNSGNLKYEGLMKTTERITDIMTSLNDKEMRWLELSEKE
jgi:ATP-binding cassette subfamily F protein uup